ncbi:hypothetical protein DAEQUDRAFT_808413 [Daedalea quercina L-15889]|uniref:TPX2 C-terminal domain-containing protein n=1 Tax=Daedalea quercina L-15889 TaxID=1314783 RepID=A0A165TE81_9APHY|nr:hypothetical protein DAEQUDRAFT_808413 [Daedalea quercina L-15889]
MVAEISMRHFPDISDVSLDQDFSESSFQIPASGGSNDLLMDEDSMEFLRADTLTTPMVPSRNQARTYAPLTLQDLTPRSTRTRATPARSSLRPRARPAIATPLRRIVAKNISDALSEDISSASGQDLSFQIPTAAAQGADSLLDTHNHFSLSDCVDITLSAADQQPCPTSPGPLALNHHQPDPQLDESLSDSAATSDARCTPEPGGDEPGEARAGNISGCVVEGQGAGSFAIRAIPSEPNAEEQRPISYANLDQADPKPLDKRINSTAPTAKHGARRMSDRLKRRKPTVLHGGITKVKPKASKPAGSVSRSVSARAVSAATTTTTTTKPPAITRVRSRAEPSNGQSGQQAAAYSIKLNGAQKSTVPSHYDGGGSGAAGGLASTLMSYGLKLADNSASSSSSQQATESTAKANLTAAPVVTEPISNETGSDTVSAEADTTVTAGADGQGQVDLPPPDPESRSASPEAYRDTDRRADLPLTLSQLSPPKPDPSAALAPARPRQATSSRAPARPPSPARAPTKRPPSAASSGPASSQAFKRSKTAHGPEETRLHASSSQDVREGPGARGARQNLASQPPHTHAHAHVRHPSADHGAKPKTRAAPGASLMSARARAASGPSTSRSPANAEEDGKRAARGQLTGTRGGSEAKAGAAASGRLGDSDTAALRDAFKGDDQEDGNARRPASAEGVLPAHEPKRSVSPAVLIAPHLASLRPFSMQALFGACTLQARRRECPFPRSHLYASALPPAKPTKPIEFHFRSDARIEARRPEGEKEREKEKEKENGSMGRSRSHAPPPAIPDFRAMHAAQEAARAARRGQIVPVVPQEVHFPTDVRARERERFEEGRRAREREVALQVEERRRLREIEEEKEVREMRRRAVPRANEVPDWYADAPRKGR